MRNLAFLGLLLATLPLTFVGPQLGVLIWSWLSFMSPHQLTYGGSLPVVMVAALLTIACWAISKEPKRLPGNSLPWLILLFMVWMTVSYAFALDQSVANEPWSRNMKTLLLALAIMGLMTNRVRV